MAFLLGSEKSGNEAMLAESVECSENIAKVRANRRAQQVNVLPWKEVCQKKEMFWEEVEIFLHSSAEQINIVAKARSQRSER